MCRKSSVGQNYLVSFTFMNVFVLYSCKAQGVCRLGVWDRDTGREWLGMVAPGWCWREGRHQGWKVTQCWIWPGYHGCGSIKGKRENSQKGKRKREKGGIFWLTSILSICKNLRKSPQNILVVIPLSIILLTMKDKTTLIFQHPEPSRNSEG